MRAVRLLVGAVAAVLLIESGWPASPDPVPSVGRSAGAGTLASGPHDPAARSSILRSDAWVPRGRARQPFGYPGADGETDAGTAPFERSVSGDPGPTAETDPLIMTPEGFQVVPGGAAAGTGRLVAYTVEVEPSVGIDPLSVAAVVEEALHDPRSWANDVALRRVDDIGEASIRIVVAEPTTVDALCAQAGLETGSKFSCWNGTFAALNAMRWEQGATDFEDITTYRRYLVNHEVGHGLEYGHEDCAAAGELAPVMMQQTKGTDGCEPNGWVYPELSPP